MLSQKGSLKKQIFFRARLVWQEDENIKKYHLVKWEKCCLPKDVGGLGILNLEVMNIALLAKWFWKMETEEGLWQEILSKKYGGGKCLALAVKKPGDSQFWASLMKIKEIFYRFVKKELGDGKNTRFWEDSWVDDKPLKEAYPRIYDICFDHNITVDDAIQKGWQGFKFRRTLHGETLELWESLKGRCEEVTMQGGRDKITWTLTADHKFSVGSLYRKIITLGLKFPHKFLWKTKVPAKIKVFLWLVNRKSILTRDTLLKKGWKGGKECVFCGKDETVDHLFFECSVASLLWGLVRCVCGLKTTPLNVRDCFGDWLGKFSKDDKKLVMVGTSALFWAIWKSRNGIIFENKRINDPFYIIKLMSHWLIDWSILQTKEPPKKVLELGARLLERAASEVYAAKQGWRINVARLE
jgi:hypothetical protein